MKEDTCDKAIEILQATSDGDKLDPLDLKLVESAVMGVRLRSFIGLLLMFLDKYNFPHIPN